VALGVHKVVPDGGREPRRWLSDAHHKAAAAVERVLAFHGTIIVRVKHVFCGETLRRRAEEVEQAVRCPRAGRRRHDHVALVERHPELIAPVQ